MPYASKEDRTQWRRDWKATPKGQAWSGRRATALKAKRLRERMARAEKLEAELAALSAKLKRLRTGLYGRGA